jgi:hypothetical protein
LNGNYKTLFNFKKWEVCKLLRKSQNYMQNLVEYANVIFKGLIHECPYQGRVEVTNASMISGRSTMNGIQIFPNGYYKLSLRIWSDKDENIIMPIIYYENFWKTNTLNFFESF